MSIRRENPRQPGRGERVRASLMILLGLFFSGCSCLVAWLIVSDLRYWIAARGWVETPARIISVELGRSGRVGSQVYCRYTYQFSGPEEYTGTRVGVSTGGDNIGSWQRDTYDRLRHAEVAGEPVPCFVNPERPEQAVLDRSLRVWLLVFLVAFVVGFAGFGSGIITSGVFWLRRLRAARRHPDQPWLWRDDWRRGVIRFHAGWVTVGVCGVAIVWNLLAWMFALAWLEDIADGGSWYRFLPGVVCLLPVSIGLVLLIGALRLTFGRRTFRHGYFKLASVPGLIGGRLEGEIVCAGATSSSDEIRVSLRCVEKLPGKRRGMEDSIVWEDVRRYPVADHICGEAELRLPIKFEIPPDSPPSDDTNPKDSVKWELGVVDSARGAKPHLSIEVPIFHIASSGTGA